MKGPRERVLDVYFADKTLTLSQIAERAQCSKGIVNSTLWAYAKHGRLAQQAKSYAAKSGVCVPPEKPGALDHLVVPKTSTRKQFAPSPPNVICQFRWFDKAERMLVQCAFETFNGSAYCPECAKHLITCLDRRPDWNTQHRNAA